MILEEFDPFEDDKKKKKETPPALELEEFIPESSFQLEEFDPLSEPAPTGPLNLQNLTKPISGTAEAKLPTFGNIVTDPRLAMKTLADFANSSDLTIKAPLDFAVSGLNSIAAPLLNLPSTLNELEVGIESNIKKKAERGEDPSINEIVSLGILKTIPGINSLTAGANEQMAVLGAKAEELAKIYQSRRGYKDIDTDKITEVADTKGYSAGLYEFFYNQDGLINVLGTNGAAFAATFMPFLRAPQMAAGLTGMQKAALLTPAAAQSMGIDMAISADSNIKESFRKSGGDYDYAFTAGLAKTAVDAFAGSATVPLFAGVKFMSKPLYDITAKWLAGGATETGAYVGIREALGEDVTSGEFLQMAGVSFALGAPLDVYAAGLFNEVGKAVNIKPTNPDLFAPKTREEHVVLKKFFFDAQNKMKEVSDRLMNFNTTEAILPELAEKHFQLQRYVGEIPNPITENARAVLTSDLEAQTGFSMTPPEAVNVGLKGFAPFQVIEMDFDPQSGQRKLNINSAGRKASRPLSPNNLKPGTVVGSLVETYAPAGITIQHAKQQMETAAADFKNIMQNLGITDPKNSQVAGARAIYEEAATKYRYLEVRGKMMEQNFKYLHNVISKWAKAVAPDEAFILVNDPTEVRNASIYSYNGPGNMPIRKISFDPTLMFSVDYSQTPDANGNYPVAFDPAQTLGVIFHELFHGFWGKRVDKFPVPVQKALSVAYTNYLAAANVNNSAKVGDILSQTSPAIAPLLETMMYGSDVTVRDVQRGGNNYVFTFPEFVANMFSKEFLYGDKIMQELAPEVRAAIAKEKVFFDDFIKKSASVLATPDYIGSADILRYLARDKRLQRETNLFNEAAAWIKNGGKGKKPERAIMKQHPITGSILWMDAFDSSNVITRTAGELLKLVENTTYSRAERQAMQDTLRDMNLDRTPDVPVSTVELAARFDQRLQFEKAIDANFESLNPIIKAIREAFGFTPKFKKISGEIAETGRISAIFKTVYQLAWDNPNNRYLKQHTETLKKMVKERNIDFTAVQPLMEMLKKVPFEDKNIIGEYMFHKHAGTISKRINELAKEYQTTLNLPEAEAVKKAAQHVVGKEYNMTRERLNVARQVFSYFSQTLNKLEAAEISSVLTTAARFGKENEVSTLNKIAGIKRKYSNMRKKGDYFPAMRFGDNALKITAKFDMNFEGRDVKAGETVYFELFESEKERQIVWNEMRNNLNSDFAITGYKVSDNLKNLRSLSLDFIYESRDAIQAVLVERGLKPEEIKATMKDVDDIARSYLSDNSFAKRMMRRKNVLGSSQDLERVVAAYTEGYSNQRTRLLLRPEFDNNMTEYRKYIDTEFSDIDNKDALNHRGRHDVIHKYMRDHAEYLFYPGWEGEGLKTLGFLWHLGMNVKSALVNFTSLPIYTYSHLARNFGDEASGRALAEAMRDVLEHGVNGKTQYNQTATDVLNRLRETGMLSQTLSRDMASVALGGTMERVAGRKYGRWGKNAGLDLLHYSGYLFQYTELFAREAAALATIKLAEKAGITDTNQIYQLAQDTIDRSLFEYGRHNRPKVFRGALSPLFLFQQFVVNSLYFATRRNTSAMRFALLTFAAAGAMGLPGAEDASDLIDTAGTLYSKYVGNGKPMDVRKFIREIFDNSYINSDFVLHGFGRNGMGLQHVVSAVTGVETEFDLSGSLSSGRLVPFGLTQYMRNVAYGKDVEPQDQIDEIAGPAYAPFFGVLAAINSPNPDAWKNVEMAMPTAIKNASKAVRWMVRGEETDRTGATVLEFDINNPEHLMESVMMSLGFTPSRVSQENQLNRMRRDHDTYWEAQKGAMMEQFRHWFTESKKSNEPRNIDELRGLKEEIKRFNSVAPPGYRIDSRGLEQSITQKMRRDILKERGFISGSEKDIGKDFSELFPDRQNRTKAEEDEIKITPYR